MKTLPQFNHPKNNPSLPSSAFTPIIHGLLTPAPHTPHPTSYSLLPIPYSLLPIWIGFFLFSIYLLSFSGRFHVMDELAVFAAGNNLAQHGRADINHLIWTNHWTPTPPGVWGIDGNLYTKKAPGVSLAAAPLIWLGHTIPGLNAAHMGFLLSALVTALTGGLLFVWLADLGFSRVTAGLTALSYGLLTIAWVYARMLWESPILALMLLIVTWALYRFAYRVQGQHRWRWVLLAGLAMAIGLTMRFEMIIAVVFVGLFLLWELRSVRVGANRQGNQAIDAAAGNTRSLLRLLALYLGPSLIIGLGLLYFNYVRFGSIWETGYSRELSFGRPWVGSFGLLFSPGRGLFIYAPFMLLLFFGLRPAWRRLPRPYFWLIAAICLFYWLFYGSWFAWGGTWGWGPRFLLPILPLLMLFIAEPLAWAGQPATGDGSRPALPARRLRRLAWLGIGFLAALSLLANLLGILVDFNEHFLRLGRNDDFVFNWAAMPLLGHWRILQEGLVDIIWLRLSSQGPSIAWPVLAPALLLFILATAGLITTGRIAPAHASRFNLYPVSLLLMSFLTIGLTYLMMLGTARLALQEEQAQADLPVLAKLATSARSGDALLVPMPPFGDVQEISTRLLSYLDRPLPTYIWIESEPRAIQPAERVRVWQAVQAGAGRVWLFERWLTPDDRLNLTARQLNQAAFPVWAKWCEHSGKLTLYALASDTEPVSTVPLNVTSLGGISLVDFAVLNSPAHSGEILKVRLTWRLPAGDRLPANLPPESIIGFVHLLAEAPAGGNIAQQDRLLLNLQQVDRSPLLPGQTIQQGYGLLLPDDLSPGSYPLIAGLYLPSSGQRLPRTDSADDFIYLTNIVVAKRN